MLDDVESEIPENGTGPLSNAAQTALQPSCCGESALSFVTTFRTVSDGHRPAN